MNNEIKRYIFSSFHGDLFNNIFPGWQPRQMVLRTLAYSLFNHLTRLLARGYLWKMKITPMEGTAKTPIVMADVTDKVWERNLPTAVKEMLPNGKLSCNGPIACAEWFVGLLLKLQSVEWGYVWWLWIRRSCNAVRRQASRTVFINNRTRCLSLTL